ncbi:hypothetical protein Tco_0407939 [Tanacetum coccineum]
MVRTRTKDNEKGQPDIAAIIAQQLQNIIPQIVTQVTNNVNNRNNNNNNGNNNNNNGNNNNNNWNGGNNGCSYKVFQACVPMEYDKKGGTIALTRWIEKMDNVLNNSGCSENQKVRGREAAIGMIWNDFKALLVEEFCPRLSETKHALVVFINAIRTLSMAAEQNQRTLGGVDDDAVVVMGVRSCGVSVMSWMVAGYFLVCGDEWVVEMATVRWRWQCVVVMERRVAVSGGAGHGVGELVQGVDVHVFGFAHGLLVRQE